MASGGQVFAARHLILLSTDNHPPSRACCSTHQSLQARRKTLGTGGSLWRSWAMADSESSSTAMAAG
eukprot:CAMPEP_0173064640 /NCGR_PEP_ID=MMETSP1102-20130122/5118_1 /TAXON_ID=49646 /ORGANISM="Geminigera sp., Strain Caron Lab Isolate" /LENGTH=66 /DNA_ID=CAMNT_0013931709 /DNA_START=196 /DNA_END=392 /DNA_ORIENTATION=-